MTRGRLRDERAARGRNRRRSRSATSSASSSSRENELFASDSDSDAPRRARHGDEGAGFSFEHLEAIRGVSLLTRNEYPLPHLPREKLFKPDDADAACFCAFPSTDDDDKRRCDDVSCLNFATYIECSPAKCDAGKYCCNQRLQHPNRFPELEAFKTEHKGFGVRARHEIQQNTVIGEYVGEIIDEKELQRRLQTVPRHELNFYYLALEPGVYIDARNKGSFTRFMNHSCEPNCKTEKWTVNGETRIAVVAQKTIGEHEELTFDYQWKSLGSKQIKCHCGSANCKGVIGSEVDATKTLVDSGPQGFYRDPTKDEVGDALVGHHLRLFLSASDTSVYAIATVRAFNPEDETYELEYVDSVGTPEDEFDSPLSAIEELRNQPHVKLGERTWQIYVELGGLSNDQIEQAVFAIPKRRPSGTLVVDTTVSPSKSDPTAATTSPSQSSTTPSSTPGAVPVSAFQQSTLPPPDRRDHDGELLDADGDIVTNKLLIKGLPPKCTEALLRRLFIAPRNARSSSMLEKLQSSMVAQRPSDAVVTKLDFFFFDDASGWALVAFADSSLPKYFRKNLNSRDLLGKPLRVFHAGRREIENFERAKRNTAIRREEKGTAQSGANGVGDKSTTDSAAPTKPPVKYPFGRALDWLVSVEQMEDSPARRKGTSAALEEKMRSLYVQTIVHVTKKLRLEREDATSAILALHRYFTFRPMVTQNIEFMAAGMLHVYLKAHGRKFSWPDFVQEVYVAKYPGATTTPTLTLESEVLKRCERQILETEMDLLEGLLFDLSCEDVYGLLDLLTSSKNRKKSSELTPPQQMQVPTDVQKEAKHLISEVLRLPVWAYTSAECVALSIFYVGTAVTAALAFALTDEPFTPVEIPVFLPTLDPVKSEKDVLALLDCSLYIVDNLKERWVRQENSAKAARLVARRADPDLFDTEAFAVQRHKPVEITQRITTLLKTWIDLNPPQSGRSSEVEMPSHLAHMTLRELKGGQRTGSFSIMDQTHSEARETPAKARDVLQLDPVARSTRDQLRTTRRLQVRDIENVKQIRKRTFLGVVSSSLEGVELAGSPVYLQPWPHREHEPVYSKQMGVSRTCARELSTALIMTSRAPQRFLSLLGIVFPNETTVDSHTSLGFDDEDKSGLAQLRRSGHYVAFEQPLHLYSGLLDAKIDVPMLLRKKAIFDMVSALALCHEWGYVHRHVAPCHLFVGRDGVRLGGYHTMRKLSLKVASKSGESGRHELTDSERKEHCHGSWLQVSPPEVLLGDRSFSMRGDIWSAGCVALGILFDKIPFLQGPDLKAQLNLVFRICGTPSIVWAEGMKLPQYAALKPKHEYKMRLRKTLLEQRQEKRLAVPTEAIDVLEAMLQLDPSKRMSAKKLLEMEYFAEFTKSEATSVDFSVLPPTYETQSRKLQHQLMKASSLAASSSSKRRRGPSELERPDSASSTESSKSRRHSSSASHRASLNNDVDMENDAADGDADDVDGLVPLPDLFQDTPPTQPASEDSIHGFTHDEPATKKRAKLGWGMGLNS